MARTDGTPGGGCRTRRPLALRWTLIALVALLAAPPAQAQRINLKAGLVTFAPTGQELVAALDCAPERCLRSAPGSADVTAKVLRQGRRAPPPLRVELGAWSGGDGPEVLVRFEIDGVQSPPQRSGWLSLDDPVDVDLPDDPVTDVRIEYRLRPRGAVPAGERRTRIELVLGSSRVEHPLVATLPTVTALRVEGTVPGASASLRFDYAPEPLAYLTAIRDGSPLPVTETRLRAVEVYTNDPRGYRVGVAVAPNGGVGLPPERILLFGRSADGLELTGDGPTGGFVPLAEPTDYGLRVDGAEASGSFGFEVRFEVLAP